MDRSITSRVMRVAAAAALLTVAVGCGRGGGDGDGRESPSAKPLEKVALAGSAKIEGAYTFDGRYEVAYSGDQAKDCKTYAGRTSTEDASVFFVLPLPTSSKDDVLQWTATIQPYDGPDKYGKDKLERLELTVRPLKNEDGTPHTFAESKGASAEATIDDDGSGKFTFAGLEDKAGDTVSGEATWTCSDK